MKKSLLIPVAIFLLGGAAMIFVLNDAKNTEYQNPSGTNDITETFPTNNVTVTIPDTPTIALKNEFGPNIQVNNFLKKPEIVPDMQNQGMFFLGNTYPSSEAGEDPSYVVTFAQDTTFFNVILLKEPLGESRLEAEAYLRSGLEITDTDMCLLTYTVSTPESISREFAGRDLRFSFCPGNISLPST